MKASRDNHTLKNCTQCNATKHRRLLIKFYAYKYILYLCVHFQQMLDMHMVAEAKGARNPWSSWVFALSISLFLYYFFFHFLFISFCYKVNLFDCCGRISFLLFLFCAHARSQHNVYRAKKKWWICLIPIVYCF